jgi:hypothetical protein
MESNAQDTYYGLAVLSLLDAPFPSKQQTTDWLREFPRRHLHSYYYVVKAIQLLDEKLNKNRRLSPSIEDFETKPEWMNARVKNNVSLEDVHMITDLAKIKKAEIECETMMRWLLDLQNEDGGFGAHLWSDMNSTYHAIASLSNLGYRVEALRRTHEFVRSCEIPNGGFSLVPCSSPTHMEYVFHGVSALDLLGEHPRNPDGILRSVFRCRNANGGFARSELGVSSFEDTFYALGVLKTIERL